MKEWTALNWAKRKVNNDNGPKMDGRTAARKVASERRRKIVREFLTSLPKVESHYCRAQSDKLYLEPIWDSRAHVYREYKAYCNERNEKPVDDRVFADECNDLKLGIFSPRKDQCDLCVGFANKNPEITDEMYETHRKRKDEARNAKKQDTENPATKFVFTMDVQAVLICPLMKASALYYKSKLIVHNFTIYITPLNPKTFYYNIRNNTYNNPLNIFFLYII